MTTSSSSATSCRASTKAAAAAGLSTLDGRCKVATTYRSGSSSPVRTASASNRSMLASSVSIIGLPTRCTAVAGLPSRARCPIASGDVTNSSAHS